MKKIWVLKMIISKTAGDKGNYKVSEYYYDSARAGMFDLLRQMSDNGLSEFVFLPGYVGWSLKEGSGIFDPINRLSNITVVYYKMDQYLNIDFDDLISKMKGIEDREFAVLVVNYFGFVDPQIEPIYSKIKQLGGWSIEDNAHGFFTWMYSNRSDADATFFSLHKMFPFEKGGSLRILNDQLKNLQYEGKDLSEAEYNPWNYNISEIAAIRRRNYFNLDALIKQHNYTSFFEPLKLGLEEGIVPQSYPIKIKVGNRDTIYELMNVAGYGVVSLYHTLIEPLRNAEHRLAYDLSKCILNLPVHQDVDADQYKNMIELLASYCEDTM